MSHYTVLVIGDDYEDMLAPYNEQDDDYSEFNNESEKPEYKEKWETESQRMYQDPEGKLLYPFVAKKLDDFKGFKDGDLMPAGWIEKFVPYKVLFDTFRKYMEEWEGFPYDDAHKAHGYYSNPNGKWDWYKEGGRWAGELILKDGCKDADGNDGCTIEHWGKPSEKIVGRCDSAYAKDIDFTKMFGDTKKYKEAARFWELYVDKATPKNKKERSMVAEAFYRESYYTDTYKTKENYAKCICNFHTFAVLDVNGWHEAGAMGWFGMSGADPDDQLNWELNFYDAFIKGLDPEDLVTIVDCHV